jgi:hypothetical protein
MPVHDWNRVKAGIFHDFHAEWLVQMKHALNGGVLPRDYYALAEQIAGDRNPDVLTLQQPVAAELSGKSRRKPKSRSGSTVAEMALPKVGVHSKVLPKWWARYRKNSIAIRHVSDHRIVAVLEIVSPGNKSDKEAIKAFTHKARTLIAAGIHLTIVDLFPPTRRDPKGVHPVIWGGTQRDFRFNSSRPLTCVSYIAGDQPAAFVETTAVGDRLPDVPIYLTSEQCVLVPLEKSYLAAYAEVPGIYRDILEGRAEWPRRGPV